MLICFTAIDSNNEHRHFSWWFDTIEIAFDVLSSLVANGSQLLKAELIDGDRCLLLPIEVFDGQPFSPVIKELENEWRHLLGTRC